MPLASLNAPFDHPDGIFELKYGRETKTKKAPHSLPS
jgi:hypothetical protein